MLPIMEKGETDFLTFCKPYIDQSNQQKEEYRAIFHDVLAALNPGVLDNVRLTEGQQHVMRLALHEAVSENRKTGQRHIKLHVPIIIATFLNSIRNEVSDNVDNVVNIRGKPKKP